MCEATAQKEEFSCGDNAAGPAQSPVQTQMTMCAPHRTCCNGPMTYELTCKTQMKNEGPSTLPELVESLKDYFKHGRLALEIHHLMNSYLNSGSKDWKEYCMWSDMCYARNRVEGNDMFELMVICWKNGQKSPIHNHAGSSCWMGVCEGKIEETYFTSSGEPLVPGVCAEGSCPSLKSSTPPEVHAPGEVAYIRDEIALHMIKPVDGDAVSLHLYSPPIKMCNIYVPELGKVSQKKMGYYSIDKKKVTV